jgi:DNA-binding transcriptional regulator YhcF (GntR family)
VRLWFAPGSDVPLYRQLVTQVKLAILGGDLQPGDRLPSTRELARRFAIHPNTISAGYRELERQGWTELRHGSGVFVRDQSDTPSTPEQILDVHIAGFFRAVRNLNLPRHAVHSRVERWLAAPPPDHFLLIDPDPEIRLILLSEIRAATSLPVDEASPENCSDSGILQASIPLCRPSKTALVRGLLPSGVELVTLPITSATNWLAPRLPAPQGHLLAVVSHWPEFLSIAQTMLAAAGFPADALLFRDARKQHWQRGLNHASAILCDSYTATLKYLPNGPQIIPFPLLAAEAVDLFAHYSLNLL